MLWADAWAVAGLAWMCQQEESNVRGGILADEMGMGKTIQAGPAELLQIAWRLPKA